MSIVSVGGDFQVYYDAGNLVTKFENPWNFNGNPNALYLHGPLTSSWIWVFSLFSNTFGLTLLRIITLVLIPFSLWVIFDVLDIRQSNKMNFWVLSSIVLLSFPTRSILNYGRFEVLVFFLFVLVVHLLKKYPLSNSVMFLCGFLLGVVLDYKPQIFLLPGVVLLWNYPKIRIFLGLILSVVFGAIVSFVLTTEFPYWTWIDMLLLRSRDTSAEEPLGLFSIYYGFGISPLLSVGLGLILIFSILVRLIKGYAPNQTQSTKLFFFVFLFFFPLLHTQDLIWIPVVLIISLARDNDLITSGYFWLVAGFMFTWSTNYYLDVAILTPFLLWIFYNFSDVRLSKKILPLLMFIMPSFTFHVLTHFFPTPADGNLRHILVLCDFFLIVGILVRQARILERH
jgi:hypothetical protein